MKILSTIAFLIVCLLAHGQDCPPPTATVKLEVNNASVVLRTGELQWNRTAEGLPGYEIPAGSGNHVAFASNFWIGGIDESNSLKMAGGLFGSTGTDFYTGPLSTDGSATVSTEACNQYDQLFTIHEYQSLMHLEYFNCQISPDCNVSELFPNGYTIPASFFSYPAHGDVSLEQSVSLAPFYDFNQDGMYAPDDGDCPFFASMSNFDDCVTCSALNGHTAVFWINNDKGSVHTETLGNPIGIEIHNVAYGFATTDEALDNTTFYQKKILYRGNSRVSGIFAGLWIDTDLGGSSDDYLGCDIPRNLGYVINGDDFDEENSNGNGYGENPPAFGIDILKGFGVTEEDENLMSSFTAFNSSEGFEDPNNAVGFYNYLLGKDMYGDPITCPNGDVTSWMYGGETYPEDTNCDDWSEFSDSNTSGDRRMLLATKTPENLIPGAKLCMTHAAIFAEDDNGNSLNKLKQSSDDIQVYFDACFDCVPPKAEVELELTAEFSFTFHNHASATEYLWDFGDGTTSSFAFPTHTFDPDQAYEVTLTISNECGTDTDTALITFAPSSIDDFTGPKISIGPNPTADYVQVFSESEIQVQFELFDLVGRKILSKQTRSNTTISLENLAKGNYLIRVSDLTNKTMLQDQLVVIR